MPRNCQSRARRGSGLSILCRRPGSCVKRLWIGQEWAPAGLSPGWFSEAQWEEPAGTMAELCENNRYATTPFRTATPGARLTRARGSGLWAGEAEGTAGVEPG